MRRRRRPATVVLTNRFSRQGYPIGIVVNREGQRFIDEGADFRNYTYAKYGAEILRQPGAIAFQLFDARTEPLLNPIDYRMPGASRHEASTIWELAEAIGIAPDRLIRTVEEFNAAVRPGEFDPAIKDGKDTLGIVPPKSNWALPLDLPPFVAFPVTCGITFTFGGIKIDAEARVLDAAGTANPRALRGRRSRRRTFLSQLPRRHWADRRRGLRPAGGTRRGARCAIGADVTTGRAMSNGVRLRWGLIGTGGFADAVFASALANAGQAIVGAAGAATSRSRAFAAWTAGAQGAINVGLLQAAREWRNPSGQTGARGTSEGAPS